MLRQEGGAQPRRESSKGTSFQRVNSDRVQNLGPNRISRLSAPQWLSDCWFTLLETVPGVLEPSEAMQFACRDSEGWLQSREPLPMAVQAALFIGTWINL